MKGRRSTPVPADEWVTFMIRLYMDGPHGPACCDVVRRFVAGEIVEREEAAPLDLGGGTEGAGRLV